MLNTFIRYIAELELQGAVYNVINGVAILASVLYSLLHGKRLGIPTGKMVIILAVITVSMALLDAVIWEIVKYVQTVNFLGIKTAVKCSVRLYVFFPLFALLLAWLLRMKGSLVCDSLAMYPLMGNCIAQFACIFAGCCNGYLWEHGIYNDLTNRYHFPVQILDALLTLLIQLYLSSYAKGRKYKTDGILYPSMMILFGIMRFICEVLRDNEKIFFGMSAISIHSLLLLIVGSVWMILYRKKEKPYGYSIQALETEEGEAYQGSEGGEAHELRFCQDGES